MTLVGLGFSKIRILPIYKVKRNEPEIKYKVVAFNTSDHPDWVQNTYQSSEREFLNAVQESTALNLSDLPQSKQYDWSFLKDYVCNIEDILVVNSEGYGL